MLSTMRSSNSRSVFSAATSPATRRYRPSVNFMMLALCTAVTLRRPSVRAWSKANCTMRRVAVIEIGLIERPESARIVRPVRRAMVSMASAVAASPSSSSMPAYRSSVFSRMSTRSTSS